MKFKFRLHLDAAILFWRKCTSHICNEKNATKPAQIIASLIQGREHKGYKGKWTSFYLTAWCVSLAFLMLSCKITNIPRKPASDQFQPSVRVLEAHAQHSLKELNKVYHPVAKYPSCMPRLFIWTLAQHLISRWALSTFFKTKWRHPGEGTIWTSLVFFSMVNFLCRPSALQ